MCYDQLNVLGILCFIAPEQDAKIKSVYPLTDSPWP